MSSSRPPETTQLLQRSARGDDESSAALVPLLYDELRHLARRLLARERKDHTLQPTALVHEAYVRLVGDDVTPRERTRFRRLAASVLRNVLVDHARKHGAEKRGGRAERVHLECADMPSRDLPLDVLDVDELLERMKEVDARAAQVVELRFFSGLGTVETAEELQVSERTVRNDWRWARAWLLRQLDGDGG